MLAGLINHSRQQVHGTGRAADRARMQSNLVQPVLARFLFLAAVVTAAGNLGSVSGLLPQPWLFWGMPGVIVAMLLAVSRQFAMIVSQVGEKYPAEDPRKVFRWGLFYFNPEDDEMIVNVGGLNIPNFGNKYLWVLLGVLGGFIGLIAALAALAG